MKNIFVLALIAFAAVSAAPSSDTENIKFIDGAKVDFSALSSKTVDENAIIDAITQMKQSFVGGVSEMEIKLSDRVQDVLSRHARAISAGDSENVPDRRERVMLKVQKKIAQLKADGKLPEHFQIPENFELPEHFKQPTNLDSQNEIFKLHKAYKVPEGVQLPEKFRQKLNL